MAKVSVLLPVFNACRGIARAVESILRQTLIDIELIVVDDGSTDETLAILERFDDSRLRIIRQDRSGVAVAANIGLKAANAGVIARMDADDYSHPDRLESQLEWLRLGDFDAVGCQIRILDSSGLPVESLRRYERWINEETLLSGELHALRFVEFPLVNPTILARREYFELGFRDDDVPEDYDLMLRAANQGMRFGKVAEVLFDWHDHSDRLTRNKARYSNDAFMSCRRKHLLQGPLMEIEQVDLWGLGKTGKPWMRWLQSHGIEVRHAYEVSARRIGEVIHGVKVLNSDQLRPTDGTPLLIAVGAANTREVIGPQISAQGYVSGRNAWFVA